MRTRISAPSLFSDSALARSSKSTANSFRSISAVQAAFAFVLTAFIGPGLVSPDLANGALTLYLCRPLSRTEYVLGKMSVLLITLSWITWIPGLVLFFVQASLSGWQWMWDNAWIAGAIVLGSLVWILVLALAALALSAWVKWRIVAGALLLGMFFLGAGFARAINAVLRTQQGYLDRYFAAGFDRLARPVSRHRRSAVLRHRGLDRAARVSPLSVSTC